MANPVLPLFYLYPPQERYELSSGIRCDVPYVCRGADLLMLHGSAELSKVVPLLAGQRYQPVSIGGGRCAAALWFADYHDTSCGAYREFIVTFAVSARTLEIPVSSPAGLAAVAAHPEATLLVHRLILNQSVPIEYGREVHGMNKYPTPQPLNIDFGAQGCRFDVSCDRQL